MGLITDEFLRDLVTNKEATVAEIKHWEDMGWLIRGKTEYFIDCDDFGGKTMSEEAQKGFLKELIDVMMIEVKARKGEYRRWKRGLKNG